MAEIFLLKVGQAGVVGELENCFDLIWSFVIFSQVNKKKEINKFHRSHVEPWRNAGMIDRHCRHLCKKVKSCYVNEDGRNTQSVCSFSGENSYDMKNKKWQHFVWHVSAWTRQWCDLRSCGSEVWVSWCSARHRTNGRDADHTHTPLNESPPYWFNEGGLWAAETLYTEK